MRDILSKLLPFGATVLAYIAKEIVGKAISSAMSQYIAQRLGKTHKHKLSTETKARSSVKGKCRKCRKKYCKSCRSCNIKK